MQRKYDIGLLLDRMSHWKIVQTTGNVTRFCGQLYQKLFLVDKNYTVK